MKLILAKTPNTSVPPPKLMRMAGFIYIIDRKFGKDSYSRPLGRYHYPRFHSYIEDNPNTLIINLHLDQKQTSYDGFKRHSGEYEGEAVAAEMARIRTLALAAGYEDRGRGVAKQDQQAQSQFQPRTQAPMNALGSGDFSKASDKYQPQKAWWKKLFG